MPKIGERHEVEIHGVAYGGDGVARLESGMTVFVPFTTVGDNVEVELTDVRKRFARAELVRIVDGSGDRVEPRCPLFTMCGGCRYQHISDSKELELKREQLESQLKRMTGLQAFPEIELPETNTPTWEYRNKIVLHRVPKTGDWGFVSGDNQTVLPIANCPIAAAPINEAIAAGELKPGDSKNLLLRCDAKGKVWQSSSDHRAHDLIAERLFDLPVLVPQGAFYQVNPGVFKALVEWLQRALAPDPDGLLIDAYSGVGVFSLSLHQGFEWVRGIESHPGSIPAAVTNADRWGVQNVEYITGRVESYFGQLLSANNPKICTALLDPPRGGCSERVMAVLGKRRPKRIVYVACDPSSLARDLKRLGMSNFRIERLAVFNMFPQTAHFETVAILERIR